nr:helix-turn-helix domain-containing protein [Phycicoccus endophyticus]
MEGRSTAAGKVLDVLATFDRERQSQTLTQIAQRTGLALSTAHRVVTELAEWGALERGEDGAWHVGLRLWEVAAVCPRTQILRDVALPFMQDLYEATHENIQLAVREGTELVFVERIAGHRSVELRTMVGGASRSRRPAWAGCCSRTPPPRSRRPCSPPRWTRGRRTRSPTPTCCEPSSTASGASRSS